LKHLQLIPITTNQEEMQDYLQHDFTKSVFETWLKLYPVWGYHPPWVGFFALRGTDTVGVGVAQFYGTITMQTTDTAGTITTGHLVETGLVIKRSDGWKLLNGQSAFFESL